jgi:hypothetical protein
MPQKINSAVVRGTAAARVAVARLSAQLIYDDSVVGTFVLMRYAKAGYVRANAVCKSWVNNWFVH